MAGQNYVYPASTSITSELSVGQNTLAAPLYSTQVAGQNPTGKLTPLSVDNSGNLNVNATISSLPLPTGAATSALQTTGNASLSSIDGKLADNYGVATGALRTAAQIGNASGAADFGSGASSAQTIRVIPATDTPAIPTKSPVNTNGSYAEITNLTTTAQTFTVPANAVGFILESPSDLTTSIIRWKIGAAATTTSGMALEPGRDSGFVPCAANVSVVASTGSGQAVNIQWILSA